MSVIRIISLCFCFVLFCFFFLSSHIFVELIVFVSKFENLEKKQNVFTSNFNKHIYFFVFVGKNKHLVTVLMNLVRKRLIRLTAFTLALLLSATHIHRHEKQITLWIQVFFSKQNKPMFLVFVFFFFVFVICYLLFLFIFLFLFLFIFIFIFIFLFIFVFVFNLYLYLFCGKRLKK